ncbi:hypothetical protein D9M68_196770 [compost metagenome]
MVALPASRLAAGFAQHPLADRQDCTALFGEWNEFAGRHHAAFGMMPAQEHLVADDDAGHHRLLHLVVQSKLLLVDGIPEIVGKCAPLAGSLVHRNLVEADGLVERGLRPVHRKVGIVDQRIGRFRILRVDGDAHAAAGLQLEIAEAHFLVQALLDPPQEVVEFGQFLEAFDRGELVAAEARHELAFLQQALHALGNRHQHEIAGGMTVQVVDFLEFVEVDADDGNLAVEPGGRIQFLFEVAAELQPVRQARQAVVTRKEGDLFLGIQALGNVFIGADPATIGQRAVLGQDRAAVGELLDDIATALADHFDPVFLIEFLGLGSRNFGLGVNAGEDDIDDLAEGQAFAGKRFGEAEDLAAASVRQEQPVIAIEQADTLRHVLERDIEVVADLGNAIGIGLRLGGVLDDLDEAGVLALLVQERIDHHMRPEARAVLAIAPTLVLKLALDHGNLKRAARQAIALIVVRIEAGEILADDFLGGITLVGLGAGIPARHAAIDVEHVDRVVLHAADEARELPFGCGGGELGMMGKAGGNQHQGQKEEGGSGNDEGEQVRLDHAFIGRGDETDFDRHGAHGGEVQRDDAERHQERRDDLRLQRLAHTGNRAECADVEQRAEHDRRDNERGVPAQVAGNIEGRHAEEMHAGNTGAEHQAAGNPRLPILHAGRDQQRRRGQHDRNGQRQGRQVRLVAKDDPGVVGKHGDEVGGPDAEAAGNACSHRPDRPRLAGRSTRALQQRHRAVAGQEAYERRQRDQLRIMLHHEACKNLEHRNRLNQQPPGNETFRLQLSGLC